LAPMDLNSTLTAVFVAEARLERMKGVEVAPEMDEVAVNVPKTGEVVADRVKVYVLPDWDVERSAYPVLLLTVVMELKQLEQESVWVFWAQPKGEEMIAEVTAPAPLPARSPPKVVEAVPPRLTARVELDDRRPAPSTARTPLVNEENVTVEVANNVPKKGEDEALKLWTVPDDTMSSGPLAVKVWVAPVRALREVMPLPEDMQVPSMAKHPSARSMPPEP